MRCPSCEKFVAFDEGNVDEVEAEIDEDSGEIHISGRVVLPCAECGDELKELNVEEDVPTCDEFEKSVVDAIRDAVPQEYRDKVTDEWVENQGSGGPLEARCKVKYEFEDHENSYFEEKVKGKTQKGVTVSGTVKRTIHVSIPGHPGTEIADDHDFEHTVSDVPSAFDELV